MGALRSDAAVPSRPTAGGSDTKGVVTLARMALALELGPRLYLAASSVPCEGSVALHYTLCGMHECLVGHAARARAGCHVARTQRAEELVSGLKVAAVAAPSAESGECALLRSARANEGHGLYRRSAQSHSRGTLAGDYGTIMHKTSWFRSFFGQRPEET